MDKVISKEGENDMDFKDNSKNMDSVEGLTKFKYKGKTIQEIIIAVKNQKQFDNFTWIKEGNNILLNDYFGKDIEAIFLNSIEVIYEIYRISKSERKKYIQKNVYSTMQIDEFLENNNIDSPTFELNNVQYDYKGSKIFLMTVEEKITMAFIKDEYSLVENCEIIKNNTKIEKEKLSKYFNDYFLYPKNINDSNDSEFIYYLTKNRKELNRQLMFFNFNSNLSKFKITGPSNEGKSTTLLYFSRNFFNIVYLNLKCLKSLDENKEYGKLLNILIYEFGRIKFTESQKASFEEIFNENKRKSYVEIIEKICLFLKKQSIKGIIIFDQFKAKNIQFLGFNDITSFFDPNLKVIISSSINDKDIGREVIKTINKYKKNPDLTPETQEYYFYYCDLIDIQLFKEKFDNNNIYSRINFNPKYIAILLEDKSIKDIKKHILEKMKYNSIQL